MAENKNSDIKSLKTQLNNVTLHDPREHVNIVFLGHVDAGKSTTCGQILLLKGQADMRIVDKYKEIAKENNRESWWIAYIMDTNEEERNKGKTVEVGVANFSTEHRRYSILDAPGHKNYVPAMISGAAQADIGILVISARKGEFEAGFQRGGQTREHALLAITLGIKKLVLAVNKMDDQTVNWDEKRFSSIVSKTTLFLKQCGFKEKDISSVPISGLLGEGLTKAPSKKICPWNCEVGLLVLLDKQKVPRVDRMEVRVPVVDCYKDMGFVVISGKIESGVIKKGDKLLVMPNNTKVTCESINIDSDDVDVATVGENVNISIKGCEIGEISRGDMLCDIEKPSQKTSLIQCQVFITELLPHKPLFSVGYNCVFHSHNLTVECEVLRLGKSNGKGKAPKKIKFSGSGKKVLCVLRLAKKVVVESYSEFPQLGRVTLRDEGRTIAIGKVFKLLDAERD